jgi:hypothetical protein
VRIYYLLKLGFLVYDPIYAQATGIEKPDYKKIQGAIALKDSASFYPKLMDRYVRSDSSLTKEEFRMLYYGFLFQDLYSPYKHSFYSDSLKPLMQKQTRSDTDYDTMIRFENLVLKDLPFSIRDFNLLSYACRQKHQTPAHQMALFKLNNVISTILSTSNGRDEKNAWHIISAPDEYDILASLWYQFGGEQSLTRGGCDYLIVQDKKDGIRGFYFDVNMLLEAESKLLKRR